jgi:alternative ribosome-rescue factor
MTAIQPEEKAMNKKSKKAPKTKSVNNQVNYTSVETGRGTIKDNYLAALVTSKVYKMQVVQAKKGKGSFKRKDKHNAKGQESYLIAA